MNNIRRSADRGHANHGWLNSYHSFSFGIWVQPSVFGIKPSYEEKHFPEAEKRGRLRLIASPVSIGHGRAGEVIVFDLPADRH
jgi:hypothetical protein